jgi:hypothetical protein
MECQIKLKELNLTSCTMALHDPALLESGGYMRFETKVLNSIPVIEKDENIATIETKVSLVLAGKLQQESVDELNDVFDVAVEFTGIFNVPASDGEMFLSDDKFRASTSERFANRIYPALRNHTINSLALMGLNNIDLPWHLDLEHLEEHVEKDSNVQQ